MPIPKPNKQESKDDYVSNFMSNEAMKREYPDEKQRVAIAHSEWKKNSSKKEDYLKVFYKEDNGELYVYGYIATTHPDQSHLAGQPYPDKITLKALKKWADEINSGSLKTTPISLHHVRDENLAGKGLHAEVKQLDDGEYGLFVENHMNKMHPDYSKIDYEIKSGFLGGFSIEYLPTAGAPIQNGVRILDDNTELLGWGLASRPINPMARIEGYVAKEHNDIMLAVKKQEHKEVTKMSEEQEKVINQGVPEAKEMTPEEKKKLDEKKKAKKVEPEKEEEKKMAKEDFVLSDAEKKEILEARQVKEKETVIKSVLESKEFKEAIDGIKVENKPVVKGGAEMAVEFKEFKESVDSANKYTGSMKEFRVDSKEMFKKAGTVYGEKNLKEALYKGLIPSDRKCEWKAFGPDNSLMQVKEMQFKTLTLGSNSTTYTQSDAELNDAYQPGMFNMLNDRTTTYGLFPKDDFSNYQKVQWRAEYARNTNTAAKPMGAELTFGNTSRQKLETAFKWYYKAWQIDGPFLAMAQGAGGIGDLFAQEVASATKAIQTDFNKDMLSEQGLETQDKVIGIPYITDSSTNTTLYGITRSSTNLLSCNTPLSGSSKAISKILLREAKDTVLIKGAELQNLVYITSYVQQRMILNLYNDAERIVNSTTPRFGFEGMPNFDGIPLFADKDLDGTSVTNQIYLVDLDSSRIAMKQPITVEMLGKTRDAVAGFLKQYWATYFKAPYRNIEINTLATS